MERLAQEVLKHNLFVTPVGENGSWLRYHPLFREFLQNYLVKKQPETARQVLYSLVRIYGQRGEWERAYAACQQLEDPATTAGMLEQAARSMLTGGRISLFQRWLNALPPGLLESRPVLLARHGLVLATQGESARGLGYLDQALARYQDEAADPSRDGYRLQLAWIYVFRALVHQIRGSHANALDDAASALALVERDRKTPDSRSKKAAKKDRSTLAQSALEQTSPEYTWLRSEAYRIRGLCQRQLGKLDEAIRNFSISLSLYQAQGNLKSLNLVLMNLGAAYLDAAEFGSALSCYKQALDYYQPQNDAFSLSSVLNDVAFLYHLRGEYVQAFSTFEEALVKASQGANLRVQALVLIGMGDLHLDLQALDLALESYRQARPITEQLNDRFLMIYLDLAEAAVARLKGDYRVRPPFIERRQTDQPAQPVRLFPQPAPAGERAAGAGRAGIRPGGRGACPGSRRIRDRRAADRSRARSPAAGSRLFRAGRPARRRNTPGSDVPAGGPLGEPAQPGAHRPPGAPVPAKGSRSGTRNIQAIRRISAAEVRSRLRPAVGTQDAAPAGPDRPAGGQPGELAAPPAPPEQHRRA